MHYSVNRISGVDNHKADATSRLDHLPERDFVQNFSVSFPQLIPWRLNLLPYASNRKMHTMLHFKRLLQGCTTPSYSRTTLHSSSVNLTAPGSTSQPTFNTSMALSPFSEYLHRGYDLTSSPTKSNQF